MEIVPDVPPSAATDEPAVPAIELTAGRALALPRVSEALVTNAIEGVLHAAADTNSTRAQRKDGWTPERITTFLNALAQCGSVEHAARAAGMTRQAAYALRGRAGGGAFALAWDAAAEQLAHARVADEVRTRALHGYVEIIVRDGKVWGERHRFDNRLTMALLTRLDAKRDSRKEHDIDTRIVAGEFDQFVAIAARGDLDAAAAFLADRHEAGWTSCEQARQLTRLGNYERYGVGLPEEIDVSDLEATDPAEWTEEQVERARRAEILEDEEDEVGGADPDTLYRQLAGLIDDDGDEEDEEEDEDEDEDGDTDGPMASVKFDKFTSPGLPGAGEADGPMASVKFDNFTRPGLLEAGERDGPMASVKFDNFTLPGLAEAGERDGPMASVKFDNFTPPVLPGQAARTPRRSHIAATFTLDPIGQRQCGARPTLARAPEATGARRRAPDRKCPLSLSENSPYLP